MALPAPGGAFRIPNPLGIESLGSLIATVLVGTVWAIVLTIAAAFMALVVRYRSGSRELRQQIKWVAFVAALALLANVVATGALVACNCDNSQVATLMYIAVVFLVFLGMPAALAIAILKYRLYEIDVIINRTVVYGMLAAALTAVYVGVVIGVGTIIGRQGSSLLTIAAAVAIALLFQPLRQRAQRLANRLVFGERATPYQVLSDFAERVGGTYGLDDVLQRTAEILAQGTGAARVDVWLRVGRDLRPAATWPPGVARRASMPLGADDALPAFDGVSRVVAVRHDDELLGALALEKPRNEALSPTEDQLLQDLASQAGLVLRNVGLAAELQATIDDLRASRRRLVEAQDEERRKIERNLHDGAQQQLVALTVQLGLLERLADDPERVRQTATSSKVPCGMPSTTSATWREASTRLCWRTRVWRRRSRHRAARRRWLPRSIRMASAATPGRWKLRCTSARLKRSRTSRSTRRPRVSDVRLAERDGSLVFEIEDDGRGFDATVTTYGTGVQGMVDRLDAIGGTLDIRSAPGEGTLVRGEVIVGHLD